MKEGRDYSLISHINRHYSDLLETFNSLATFELFVNSKDKRKAILFDFLQIGELFNQLSRQFKDSFNNENTVKVISIRNRIVHGYDTIIDETIYTVLKEDLPVLMQDLNEFSIKRYFDTINSLLGKEINVVVDFEMNTKKSEAIYPIYTGCFEGITDLDGKFQEILLIGLDGYEANCTGKVVEILPHPNKRIASLIVLNNTHKLDEETIRKSIEFAKNI